ncbi:MAG: hypothetical protein K2I93_01730, partial [Oscillospiraceae bacterium]|nr:hypothetical protein [Oscillospiraceae bacterium]
MVKKLLAMLTCTTLLLCGCSKGQRTGATLEVDLTHSYASELVDMQGMKVRPIAVTEQGIVMQHFIKDNNVRLYLYNLAENTYTKIEKTETNSPAYITQLPDGRLAALYDIAQGRKNNSNVYDGKTRMLEIYDSELHSAEIQYLGEDIPEQVLLASNIAMDAEGYWYLFAYDENGFYSLTVLNPDLTVRGTIELDSMTGEYLAVGKSGKVYGLMTALTEQQFAEYNSYQLYRFDVGTMTAERLDNFDVPADIRGITDGSVYELYYYDDDCIYGINEDGTTELNVEFMNSDFPDYVYDCIALPNGEFIIEYSEDNNHTLKYYQLRPRTEEEIKNTQVISLAGVALSHQLVQDVCKYNQSQLDYRIVIKDYAADYKEAQYPYTEAVEQFKNDLLGGVVPDIICMDNMPYQQLSNKGLLTDFAPMLEEDERFDPNQYHMNIFE